VISEELVAEERLSRSVAIDGDLIAAYSRDGAIQVFQRQGNECP
jgi:hypothetical protein